MKEMVDVIEEFEIHTPTKNYRFLHPFLLSLKNENKFNQVFVKGLGKGKWLLSYSDIQDNSLHIRILSPYEYINSILEIIPNRNYSLNLSMETLYLQELKKRDNIYLGDKIIFKTKLEKCGNSVTNLIGAANGVNLNRNEVTTFLRDYFKWIYLSGNVGIPGWTKIVLTSHPDLSNDFLCITMFLSKNEIKIYTSSTYEKTPIRNTLEWFNKMFLCNLNSVPGYCLWYIKIKEIKKGWKGKRSGVVINEVKSIHGKKKVKKYMF